MLGPVNLGKKMHWTLLQTLRSLLQTLPPWQKWSLPATKKKILGPRYEAHTKNDNSKPAARRRHWTNDLNKDVGEASKHDVKWQEKTILEFVY